MLVKHVLASAKDRKPTILNSEIQEFIGEETKSVLVLYGYGTHTIQVKYNRTRGGKTWYPEEKFPRELTMPKVGQPILLEVKQLKTI